MTATATKTISFTINRTALRGLADLTTKDSTRFNGMTCVRIWGKGEKVYACATEGTVAGLWHESNPESFRDFVVYLPVATVKAITKIGKKFETVQIDIEGDIIRAKSGVDSTATSVASSVLYDSVFPPIDAFLRVFRPSGELSKTIPDIAYDTIGKFSYFSDSWEHPYMTSQDNDSTRAIFLQYPNHPNFVGLLMPLHNESKRDIYHAPEWLNDLMCESN